MSASNTSVNGPPTTTATLLYSSLPPDGSKPYASVNVSPTGERDRNFTDESHTVEIENVRGKEAEYTLDGSGFQFFESPAKHKTFRTDEEVKGEYYPESEELIKRLTGASRVVLFDHTIRRRNPEDKEDTPDKRQPVSLVHVDQTPESATARVHRHLPASDVPALLSKRFQILNLWRPIGNPAFDWPLTLCDFKSVEMKRDLVRANLIYPDRDPGETFIVRFDEGHKWKYLFGMRPEEGVLIKCFDSVGDGSVAVLTPHTAFDDPATPQGSPLRQSVELRALVFYD
jgi:hypothetical protein